MSSIVKPFKSYEQQVGILQERGMLVGSQERAVYVLERVSYYRLSGYYYSFRRSGGKGAGLLFASAVVGKRAALGYFRARNGL